jgi:hypothetical protein
MFFMSRSPKLRPEINHTPKLLDPVKTMLSFMDKTSADETGMMITRILEFKTTVFKAGIILRKVRSIQDG